ncbi:MAG: (2Fe-2S)-binding protein, partial [Planctomycetes bacterium]|nr:(2Fe-2S)-binding protein [Planctomycetota bacterium]
MVQLTIDDIAVDVPDGTLVLEAAMAQGIDVPTFCYQKRLSPLASCRMCLVAIEGAEQLQPACVTPVMDGMVVHTATEQVAEIRKSMLELLLANHPLDCPICDKGGECPLQDLTMGHGSGESRFLFDDKIRLAKHYPLGELIFLDRERCIQCARCTRFQDEIVGDPVIGFYERGRRLEIVTYSDPGFDSYFSGNTTDICPVGALTTADFRFGARPWELNSAASICPPCPWGCGTTSAA